MSAIVDIGSLCADTLPGCKLFVKRIAMKIHNDVEKQDSIHRDAIY
jgi:hypothetical protein